MLTELEKERYARHFLLTDWDETKQEKLKNTTVFVAGAGGTGSPTIAMLALLGVGKIKICDFDVFMESNKNRQFLHNISEERVGMNKAESAAMTVRSMNPNVEVEVFSEKFTAENIEEMVGDSDYIFDCVDKFKYKFILADCAEKKKIPMFFYEIMGYNTFGYIFYPPKTACFRCLFNERNIKRIEAFQCQNGDVAVMAPTLFSAAGLMMNQAVKLMLGYDLPSYNTFFMSFGKQDGIMNERGVRAFRYWNTKYFNEVSRIQGFNWKTRDSAAMFEVIHVAQNPECPHCGGK